ncbi:MAG: hypothetical protein IGQ88_03835 [Gloeomargaritaceae cyanobacterium C42_A2020_066]|nr:hypothetical protein [Gloeomargaritaceae cyanobacterium C42_A2020_066]
MSDEQLKRRIQEHVRRTSSSNLDRAAQEQEQKKAKILDHLKRSTP